MNRSALCIAAVLVGLWLTACTSTPPVVERPAAPGSDVEARLARMSVEQKAAQLMIIGFDGPAYDAGLRNMIEQQHVGGVIFFARNVVAPDQVARLNNELQASALATSGIGLFTAIDQEGGRVARLTEKTGFTEFPGAMALGASAGALPDVKRTVQRVATAMAEEMRAVGFNTNFAPDLDVNNNPANPVIGIRSFGSDPRRVAELGVAFMEGLQANGVLAFGKHFPGHGDTGVDSHAELPVVSHARTRLDAVEFVPFKAAIAHGIAGIMTAHVSFPTIDPTPGLPGTLSTKVLTDLLRHDLHFDGLVVTDSLEMGALEKSGFPGPKAASRALQAGADLLLFNSGYALHQAAIRQIAADVAAGVVPVSRLDDAVRRVLRAKARFNLLRPAAVDVEAAARVASSPAHKALAREAAAAAITLLRNDSGEVPLRKDARPVVIGLSTAAGLAEAINGIEFRMKDVPTDADITAAVALVRSRPGAPVIVTLAGARPGSGQARLARALIGSGARLILVATREPYDLLTLGEQRRFNSPTLLATYGANPVTMSALAAVLRGDARAAGQLPVELPGQFRVGAGMTSLPAP